MNSREKNHWWNSWGSFTSKEAILPRSVITGLLGFAFFLVRFFITGDLTNIVVAVEALVLLSATVYVVERGMFSLYRSKTRPTDHIAKHEKGTDTSGTPRDD